MPSRTWDWANELGVHSSGDKLRRRLSWSIGSLGLLSAGGILASWFASKDATSFVALQMGFAVTTYQRAEALRRRAAGETLVEIAKSFNVSHMTIARLMAQ